MQHPHPSIRPLFLNRKDDQSLLELAIFSQMPFELIHAYCQLVQSLPVECFQETEPEEYEVFLNWNTCIEFKSMVINWYKVLMKMVRIESGALRLFLVHVFLMTKQDPLMMNLSKTYHLLDTWRTNHMLYLSITRSNYEFLDKKFVVRESGSCPCYEKCFECTNYWSYSSALKITSILSVLCDEISSKSFLMAVQQKTLRIRRLRGKSITQNTNEVRFQFKLGKNETA